MRMLIECTNAFKKLLIFAFNTKNIQPGFFERVKQKVKFSWNCNGKDQSLHIVGVQDMT